MQTLKDGIIHQLQPKVNAKIIERISAPSDTMTMESNATLRKAATNYDNLYDQLNKVFESQLKCQNRIAELQLL